MFGRQGELVVTTNPGLDLDWIVLHGDYTYGHALTLGSGKRQGVQAAVHVRCVYDQAYHASLQHHIPAAAFRPSL